MNKFKSVLSGFVILTIVCSALAFKSNNFFGQGVVYCTSTCTSRIDFKPDTQGLATKVCGTSFGIENNEYALVGTSCTQLASGLHYSATAVGK